MTRISFTGGSISGQVGIADAPAIRFDGTTLKDKATFRNCAKVDIGGVVAKEFLFDRTGLVSVSQTSVESIDGNRSDTLLLHSVSGDEVQIQLCTDVRILDCAFSDSVDIGDCHSVTYNVVEAPELTAAGIGHFLTSGILHVINAEDCTIMDRGSLEIQADGCNIQKAGAGRVVAKDCLVTIMGAGIVEGTGLALADIADVSNMDVVVARISPGQLLIKAGEFVVFDTPAVYPYHPA